MVTDPVSIAIITGTFVIAGAVKGVIGLGLPTVSLGLLTAAFDLTTAMALMLVPSFVTNLWQAMVGGHGRALLARLWPFLLAATATVWVGAAALTRIDLGLLSALLGALLVLYASLGLAGARITVSPARERWIGPLLGTVNGILTGMTGSFVVPGVLFLQAIGLARDHLVQAMGILFTVSTVALAVALERHQMLGAGIGITSTAAVIPAIAGMLVGQRIRHGLSEARFRRVFFVAIAILGAYIVATALSRP